MVLIMASGKQSETTEFKFEPGVVVTDLRRLVNQIWKLLPMRENQEDWQGQIKTVLLELRGLDKIFGGELDFLVFVTELYGLLDEADFMIYRKTVFSAISLLTDLANQLDGRTR